MKQRGWVSCRMGVVLAVLLGARGVSAGVPATGPASGVGVADRGGYLREVEGLLREKWPRNRTVNVVCHGHSVPAGYARTPVVRAFDAYPMRLHEALCEAYPYAVINVIVTGIGGENSEAGAARFARDVLSHRPDVVTIDYGLNDRGIGLARARRAWVAMIEEARAAGVKVILMTPTGDLTAKLDDPEDPLNQQARQIRELAAEYHVGLVDSLELFKEYVAGGGKLGELMAQSNHPNRKGHEIVARGLMGWFGGGE